MLRKLAGWLRPGVRESAAVASLLVQARETLASGDHLRAGALTSEALTLEPRHAGALKFQGTLLLMRGEQAAALASFESATREDGDNAETWLAYGNALNIVNRNEDAELAFRRAIRLLPDAVETHKALGNLLLNQKRNPEAKAEFERALEVCPDDRQAAKGLGIALFGLARYGEAVARLRPLDQAGELDIPGRVTLGMALTQAGELEDGRHILERVRAEDPGNFVAALNLGLNYLLAGRWQEGFELYEARHDAQVPNQFGAASPWIGYLKVALADTPGWSQGGCEGKRLLIWGEQGFGDSLMMLRALPVLLHQWQAAAVTYLCAPSLEPFSACFEGIRFLVPDPAWRAAPGEFDAHCSIMSLPKIMGITPESIPGNVPYIRVTPERRSPWESRVNALRGLKVGLVWAGGTSLGLDHLRSLSLSQLSPVLGVDGVSFVSLQKDEAAREELRASGLPIADWMGEVRDFLDTAGLMSHLDLIIAVDTALAHLAGAMGKPVWMLNRFESEWRWLRGREDSVWYPTMRIFSQSETRNWTPVVNRVAAELARLAAAGQK